MFRVGFSEEFTPRRRNGCTKLNRRPLLSVHEYCSLSLRLDQGVRECRPIARGAKAKISVSRNAEGCLKTRDSNNPLRFDLLIFLLWHRGQWVGIRVLPDPTAMTSYNIRARTGGGVCSILYTHFCDVG